MDGAASAHAIADRADPARGTGLGQDVKERGRIAPGHVLARAIDHAPQRTAGGLFGKGRLGVQGAIIAEAIEEIGDENHIALTREALGHRIERGPRAEGIHVEDDARHRLMARAEQPCLGGSVFRPDRNVLLCQDLLLVLALPVLGNPR
jgi:hypothetical protein